MIEDPVIWTAFERIATEFPDRPYIITSTGTTTFDEARQHAERLAATLHRAGLGHRVPRSELNGWESGQDHLAFYVGNRPAYVEGLLAAFRARVVPVNINYRYVANELVEVMSMSRCRGVIFDVEFAETLRTVLPELSCVDVLIQVGGDAPAVPGAVLYEDIIADPSLTTDDMEEPTVDDLCIICTGGTTGRPKAVLWRQADLICTMLGDRHIVSSEQIRTLDDLVRGAGKRELRAQIAPPMMHLTGIGLALLLGVSGGTVVFPDPPYGIDADEIWRSIERDRVELAVVVGDAFGRPMLEALRRNRFDLSSLRVIMNGAAAMTPAVKLQLAEALGGTVRVTDGIGSSESGVLARSVRKTETRPGVFNPTSDAGILSVEMDRWLAPEDASIGWLAGRGRIPLGYLDDAEKTAATFPVIDGQRCTVPGDRARWLPDGAIEVLGRDATTINTGGEKVFSDEVERVLVLHPAIEEALVVGRPSERWGQEVVALVVLSPGQELDRAAILASAGEHLTRYKLPKDFIAVPRLERTAIGKPDYAWGRTLAAGAV